MLILGIETSCDETAAAVVADGRRILSNVVASQVDLHARYGGVFPELASRAHIEAIVPVIREAMAQAGATWDDLTAIAVTVGPGLVGSLLVGVNVAKGLALGRGLPLVPVNHLEAHLYANWLESDSEGRGPVRPLLPPPGPHRLRRAYGTGPDAGPRRLPLPGGGRWTTRRARRLTRWGGCWGFPIPAAPA
jgi:tRNA threonylcarbamoyl adenosine modification protein YeaZ